MVDVSEKSLTTRTALAEAVVHLGTAVMERLSGSELHGPKGPVLQTAVIAGTMAVKKTSELIPFCHPLPIESCRFETRLDGTSLHIRCEVGTTGKTGVEMEALTGASVAALTVYDMCKAVNKAIRIDAVQLLRKTGGKSGDYSLQP